ncbi:MAG: hypothetical protein IJR26_09415, partial [Bacteroidales bacterium]|nr:hypothetical protein [Bacteroidales bacterium]
MYAVGAETTGGCTRDTGCTGWAAGTSGRVAGCTVKPFIGGGVRKNPRCCGGLGALCSRDCRSAT